MGNKLVKAIAKPTGRYTNVLPSSLKLYYDESDEDILDLRSRAAVLDAMLKKTLAEMEDRGAALDSELIRANVETLLCAGLPEPFRTCVMNIHNELERASAQKELEVKARSLVKEITDVIKVETSRLVAIGGALTLPQIGGIINGIMTIALKFMASANHRQFESDRERAVAFITAVRKNVVATPFNDFEQLDHAANVIVTPSMVSDEPKSIQDSND